MADLDSDLSRRLSRLAAAVPTSRTALDPVHRSAVEARQRVRMAWVTPLVVLVAAAAVVSLLDTSPFGAETITATDRSGDYELTIRSAKPSYSADEPIVIEASLLYDGPESSVRISHGGGASGGPLGFGTVEPVIGSLRLGTVFDMARHSTVLERGRQLTVPFAKGAGAFGNDPLIDQYTAYLEDPVLRLPPGTWHLIATAGFTGTGGDVGLRAVIEIVVTPAATSGPVEATPFTNGPVTDSVTSGPFILSMRSAKERYEPGESIGITAALTYLGSDGSVEIRHAIGARESPLGFGVDEPVLGDLRLGPVWETACVSTTMHASIPVDQEFMKASAWSGGDPRAAEYHEYVVSTGLRLPAGTWHVYSVAEFSVGECGADPIEMRVDLTIHVGEMTPEPSEPTGAVVATTRSGDFELTLRAGAARYVAGEPIDISATLTYLGQGGPIEIGHLIGSDGSPFGFGVNESIFGGYHLSGGSSRLTCHRTTLLPSEPLTTSFRKAGGGSGDDVVGFTTYMRDPVLWLPAGTWHPYAIVQSATGCAEGRQAVPDMRVEIEIDVVPAPATASTQASPIGLERWKSTVPQGDFELRLEAASGTVGSDETLNVVGSLVYRGPEERIVIGQSAWGPIGFTMAGSGANLLPSGPPGCAEIDLGRNEALPVELRNLSEPQGPFSVDHGLYEIGALASFRIGGCAGPQASIASSIVVAVVDGRDDIPLFTDHSGAGACLLVRNGGRLATSDTGLGVVQSGGQLREVVWPSGYSARRSPEGALLIGRDGQIVAREGDQIVFDAWNSPEGPLFPCADIEAEDV
jgi:hypothetical protein